MEVVPSILTDRPGFLAQKIKEANETVDRVHIDIIDGIYAKNKTVSPDAVFGLEHLIRWDFHLMVKDPVKWVKKSAKAGADRIIAQVEMMHNQREFVEDVLSVGSEVGLAIDLDTDLSILDEEILDSVDVLLVMSVAAGFDGQQFNSEALNKIKTLDQLRQEKKYRYLIADDGGITETWVEKLVQSGVDQIVIGKRIFEGDLFKNIKSYQDAF